MKYRKSTTKEFRLSSPKVEIRYALPLRTTEAAPLPVSGKRTTLRDLIDRALEKLDARRN